MVAMSQGPRRAGTDRGVAARRPVLREPPGARPRLPPALLGWVATLAVLVRVFVVVAPLAGAFVVVTALAAGSLAGDARRAAVGVAICVGLPLLVRGRAVAWLRRLGRRGEPPSAAFFLALGNVVILATLTLGFADDTGRALRRHGDWFLGERRGAVARHVRATVGDVAGVLEHFDPEPALVEVAWLPPDDRPPPPPGETPPPEPPAALWYHPLLGPERQLPGYASRRFGASRAVVRPPECELGHCGVDIGSTIGEPVLAVFDGVVDRVQRNPDADPISGIFVILSHKQGAVRSRYIHLDSVRADLAPGSTVRGGEVIGRLGRTGVRHSAAHLHFGLSVREHGHERYVDPEPYLREWTLVERDELVARATPR